METSRKVEQLKANLKALVESATDSAEDQAILALAKRVFARETILVLAAVPSTDRDLVASKIPPLLATLGDLERGEIIGRLAKAWGTTPTQVRKAVGKASKEATEVEADEPKISPHAAVQDAVKALGGLLEDDGGKLYLRIGSGVESLNSPPAKRLIARAVQTATGIIVGARVIEDAVLALEAEDVGQLPMRIGGDTTEQVVIDLADGTGEAITIRTDTIEVGPSPTVFRRRKITKPLPRPVLDQTDDEVRATLCEFWSLLGIDDPLEQAKDFAWIMACGRRGEEYPILAVLGEKGSGKTTETRLCAQVIDPTAVKEGLSVPPRPEGLAPIAQAVHAVVLDNASRISQSIADALCRFSTGSANVEREMYTNDNPYISQLLRPVAISSIKECITQPDLLDRTLIRRRVKEGRRRTPAQMQRAFVKLHPRLLGAFARCLQRALQRHEETVIDDVRLCGPASWAAAAEELAGFEGGTVRRAYLDSDEQGKAIESEDVVVEAMLRWADRHARGAGWTGTMDQLRTDVEDGVWSGRKTPDGYPRSPQGLRAALDRHKTLLADRGLAIDDLQRSKTGRRSKVTYTGESFEQRKVDPVDRLPDDELYASLDGVGQALPQAPVAPANDAAPEVKVEAQADPGPVATITVVPPGRHTIRVTQASPGPFGGYSVMARFADKDVALICEREHLPMLGVQSVPDDTAWVDEGGTIDVVVEATPPPEGSLFGALLRRAG